MIDTFCHSALTAGGSSSQFLQSFVTSKQ